MYAYSQGKILQVVKLFHPVFTKAKLKMRLMSLAKTMRDDMLLAESKLREHVENKTRQAGKAMNFITDVSISLFGCIATKKASLYIQESP